MTGGEGLVAGVDCSTQSTTVLVVDPADGTVAGRGSAPHEVTGEAGARRSDPEGWWTALRDALAQTGCAGRVAAIAVAGQQHGLVVGQPPGRGTEEGQRLARFGERARRSTRFRSLGPGPAARPLRHARSDVAG